MMPGDLFECTKLAAYYLWEQTDCDQALHLWYCAEDIACFFEQSDILNLEALNIIINQETKEDSYIWFVRHIAFRLYVFTNIKDEFINWYAAERLLKSHGWIENALNMAMIMRFNKDKGIAMDGVRSDNVRAFYAK